MRFQDALNIMFQVRGGSRYAAQINFKNTEETIPIIRIIVVILKILTEIKVIINNVREYCEIEQNITRNNASIC